MKKKLLMVGAPLLACLPVVADVSTEAANVLYDVRDFEKEVGRARDMGLNYTGLTDDPAKCKNMIEKARKMGVRDADMVEGYSGNIRFSEAAKLCEDYRRWKLTLDAARYLHNFGLSAPDPATTKPGELGGQYGENWSKKGQECVAETKKFLSAGAFPDIAIPSLNFKDQTIKQAVARCETMISWGKKYAVDTENAKAAKTAAIRQKYVKAGFKGDRLEQFIHYNNVQWKVAGCRNEDDLQKLRKAVRLFQWLENNDGTVGIRTFVFKGDKLLSVTDKKFLTSERANAACN